MSIAGYNFHPTKNHSNKKWNTEVTLSENDASGLYFCQLLLEKGFG